MRRRPSASCWIALTILVLGCTITTAQAEAQPGGADALAQGFAHPPQSVRPMTWWHWMGGNVTRAGITADLEAMQRVGLRGAVLFHVGQLPIDGDVAFGSDEWWDLMRFAAAEARRLGLELGAHNCPGWSAAGGPWVPVEQSMQKVVWSETRINGPGHIEQDLPRPQVDPRWDYYQDIALLAVPAGEGPIPADRVLDISDRINPDGHLVWDAPTGSWVLLRFGHTTTGQHNAPAPPGAAGLEADKLNPDAIAHHFRSYPQKLLDNTRIGDAPGLTMLEIDSYEAGPQNWSPVFRSEFIRRRHYDPVQWLPVLAGRIVQDDDAASRFRWDMQQTVAELYRDNFYGFFADLVHLNPGVEFLVEPYGGPFEPLAVGGTGDMVMGEFWQDSDWLSVSEAVSSAHVYGKTIAAAEAFTGDPIAGQWKQDPFALKASGDRAFARGVNLMVLHTSAHQPWPDAVPGMTMGWWGTHFGRTQTWWDQAPAWIDYLSRCQFMLQQGLFVADVCNIESDRAPAGYKADACGREALLERLSVREGRIVLPDGMSYRVLVLPEEATRMTPQVARRVRELVRQGATVIAPKPIASPSLSNAAQADAEVRAIAEDVWADCDGTAATQHAFGNGQVIWGRSVEQVLGDLGVSPDVTFPPGAWPLEWTHRRTADADIYFLANPTEQPLSTRVSFRISGKAPELWNPVTGHIAPAPAWEARDGRTDVPLRLDPAGSIFVVFRKSSGAMDPIVDVVHGEQHLLAPQAIASGITIQQATYGVLDDPAKTVDVTEVLSQRLREGGLPVGDNTLAGDPAPFVYKAIRLRYVDGGEEKTLVAREGQPILFDAGNPRLPAPPSAQLHDGSLIAWEPGAYDLHFASGRTQRVDVTSLPDEVTITGLWDVQFQPDRGAPERIDLPALISWTTHPDAGVKYFSGTATYRITFNVPADLQAGGRVIDLDLGDVRNLAEVELNGQPLGVWWAPPFRRDVTDHVKPGPNQLTVRVTNLWPNRLIGDEQQPEDLTWGPLTHWTRNNELLPAGRPLAEVPDWLTSNTPRPSSGRVTVTTWKFYDKDSPLLDSGLLGPVRLVPGVRVRLDGGNPKLE